ncbi:succinate dehydrogenase, hydrophobic membrane anchor protein [bacterium]|nr:succinate dehydrogenase, hydrophobic membrane anchor protein [bacterium]
MIRNKGLNSGGAFAWFFQRITGIALFLMLLAHFLLLHYSGIEELTFEEVSRHLSQPFWKVFDITFLLFGVYHGINGLFMVLCDYVHHNAWRLLLTGVLWLGGITVVVLGSLTIFSLGI